MAEALPNIVKDFKDQRRKGIEAVEKYLTDTHGIVEIVRASLQLETQQSFSPDVFQWLYDCVSLKRKSSKVFVFIMQFVPDLILLYLQSVSQNYPKLKAPVEVLLLAITKEVESDKDGPLVIPSLTRSSIYHQTTVVASQSRLTETALSRHNYDHTGSPSTHATPTLFTDKQITATNRFPFLTIVTRACTNNMTLFNAQSQKSFCLVCTRIALSGMTDRCIEQVLQSGPSHQDCIPRDDLHLLSKAKRFNLTDDFLSSLINGIRMCLFQSCYYTAKQALLSAKIRAEYNFHPQSLQISQTLERQVNEIHPLRLPLDTEIHKTYSNRDGSNWACRPSTVIRTMMGQVLYHHLNPLLDEVDSPHDVSNERLSIDADELLVSQSYDGVLEQGDVSKSPTYSDEDEDGLSFQIREINESPSVSFQRKSSEVLLPNDGEVSPQPTDYNPTTTTPPTTTNSDILTPSSVDITVPVHSNEIDEASVSTLKTTMV